MLNLSANWYFNFHEWISSNYTLDHQSLQCLNQYIILLIELQRKKYEFTTKYYNLIQEHVEEIKNEIYFKNHQKFQKFKEIQFIELLKFILIEIKDQIEFGEKLRIERYIKEELKENGFKRNDEYFGTSDDGEIIEFDDDDDDDDDTFKNNTKRSTLMSLYSRDSIISTKSSLSIFSINYTSTRLQFYPKRTFDYLNNYDDNLYKLILKKQLEIIYEIGDVNKNIESLKILLLKHDPFQKQDASLFLIIIYSTFQLLEKLKKFDITINIENWELIIDLIYNLEIFMKRIKHITLNLANRKIDDSDKSILIKFFLYSIIIIIFQLYFLSSFIIVCSPY
ncbi:hypothetical protein C1646_762244 [Rhizophagus diaphanus]|nr:hypothetical protein C1646_762244 [Rhizophagus diaphanus] [Rhizophagus sp. MUCL 43196]